MVYSNILLSRDGSSQGRVPRCHPGLFRAAFSLCARKRRGNAKKTGLGPQLRPAYLSYNGGLYSAVYRKSRKLLFPESTRWRIVAPGPALGTGRSRRGHGSAARDSGPGSLTERLSARRPFPVLRTGWVALTAEQSACRGRQLGVLAWATSTSRRLTVGSRPLCLRAVVCCPAPSSACSLRGRRHMLLEVLQHVETMRIALRSQEALAPLLRPLRGHESGCLGGAR